MTGEGEAGLQSQGKGTSGRQRVIVCWSLLCLALAAALPGFRSHLSLPFSLCRLLEQLGTDPLLARLLRAQNQRLHEMAEQGLDHPSFHSD